MFLEKGDRRLTCCYRRRMTIVLPNEIDDNHLKMVENIVKNLTDDDNLRSIYTKQGARACTVNLQP